MPKTSRRRQSRLAAIVRQHCADQVDRSGQPAMRWNPLIDKRPDFRPYGHAQPTHQARLKIDRCAQRQAKGQICNGDAYLAMFRDFWIFLNSPDFYDLTQF